MYIVCSDGYIVVVDPNLELRRGVGGRLIYLPYRLFSLLSFLPFLPKIRGPFPTSATVSLHRTPPFPPSPPPSCRFVVSPIIYIALLQHLITPRDSWGVRASTSCARISGIVSKTGSDEK